MIVTDVKQQAKTLADGIRSSREYHFYHEMKQKISENAQLHARVNTFRKRYFLLANSRGQEAEAQCEALEAEFADILSKPAVREFLAAEQRFCRLMQNIYDTLDEAADFDLGFMFDSQEG